MNTSTNTESTFNAQQFPKHIAIIMDGNNRWAKSRGLPGIAGHKAGLEAIRGVIKSTMHYRIPVLTLYAFSTENWSRPHDEVQALMNLLAFALSSEVNKLHKNNIRLRVIGNTLELAPEIQSLVSAAEDKTNKNDGLQLNVAVNYGGRWDILTAAKSMARSLINDGTVPDMISDADFTRHLCLSDLPEVDLCIRTGGEYRISNFLLWQMAYAELVFVDGFWPDFQKDAMQGALDQFSRRQRNFGNTGARSLEDPGA